MQCIKFCRDDEFTRFVYVKIVLEEHLVSGENDVHLKSVTDKKEGLSSNDWLILTLSQNFALCASEQEN